MNNTTNDTDTILSAPFVGQSLGDAARAIFATVGGIIILGGVAGNGLLITVILGRFRQKQYLHDLFLANLALADTVTLGYWLTFFVLDMILGCYPVVNQTHCEINGMIICISTAACILSLLAISVNRYLHVCHSRLYKRLFTWFRTVVICISIWIVATVLTVLPALTIQGNVYYYSVPTHECTFNPDLTYTKIVVPLFTVAPMIVIGYCNFAIFRFWKKAKNALGGWKDTKAKGRLFTSQNKSSKKAEAVASEESLSEGGKRNPVSDSEELSRTGATSFSEREESEIPAMQTEITACNSGKPDDAMESISQTMHSFSSMEKGSQEWRVRTTLHTSGAEFCLNKDMNNGEHLDKVTENRNFSGITPHARENDPESSETTGKSSSKNSEQKTEESTGVMTTMQTPGALRPSPSHSTMTSLGETTSKCNRQNHMTTVTQNLQSRRKKPNAKEVAFVRSLFIVFILACVTFIPFGIITAVPSIKTVSAEIRMTVLLVLISNSSLNWVVYGVMNPSFRKAYRTSVRQLFSKCCPWK